MALRQGLQHALRSVAARRAGTSAARSFSIAQHAADKFVVVRLRFAWLSIRAVIVCM